VASDRAAEVSVSRLKMGSCPLMRQVAFE